MVPITNSPNLEGQDFHHNSCRSLFTNDGMMWHRTRRHKASLRVSAIHLAPHILQSSLREIRFRWVSQSVLRGERWWTYTPQPSPYQTLHPEVRGPRHISNLNIGKNPCCAEGEGKSEKAQGFLVNCYMFNYNTITKRKSIAMPEEEPRKYLYLALPFPASARKLPICTTTSRMNIQHTRQPVRH